MALKLHSKSNIPSKANILRISKYENPQEAINLMAQICNTKHKAPPISLEKLEAIWEQAKQKNLFDSKFRNYKLGNNIKKIINDLKIHINQNEIKGYIKVIVAGGYSAGKSSMINKITNIGKLLPEGIEPVSVISTYVYCTEKQKNKKIQGRNLKGHLVDLEESVLECIQHSSKSKVYLASVLEKIYIETYAPEYNGIVFIDTPGYNNSSSKNTINNRTDRETAIEEFEQGDILLWLIDCEAGTISSTDLEIINQFNGKKIIVFTKSDKKDSESINHIIQLAAKQLNINNNKDILDILAFSTKNGFSNSYNKNNEKSLIDIIKNTSQPHSILDDLRNIFNNKITELKKYKQHYSDQKNKNTKKLTDLNKNSHRYYKRDFDNEYNKLNKKRNNAINSEKKLEERITLLNNIYRDFSYEIKKIKEEHKIYTEKESEKYQKQDELNYNIFDAIKTDNMQAFYRSLSNGVDITACNEHKYNPITWAIRYGNNEIVKIFLKQDVDFSIKDKNGYNGLETAVIYHFKDIYELIIEAQKDNFSKKDLENLLEIAEKNKDNFKIWLNNTINKKQ